MINWHDSCHINCKDQKMEAEADLINFGRKPVLEMEFDQMLADDDIEKELMILKSSLTKKDENVQSV